MEWKQQNGIYVPDKPLAPIEIFVDETFLQNRSGFFQAGFPVPSDIYDTMIVPKCRELLARLGTREFKGAAIKRGNVGPYREFLRLFTSVSAHIADHAPLFPVVSFDAMATYAGQQFDRVRFNVDGAFNNLNVSNVDYLIAEFSRQMLWGNSGFLVGDAGALPQTPGFWRHGSGSPCRVKKRPGSAGEARA